MTITPRDFEELDPLRLDREIAGAAEGVRRWRRRLKKAEGFDEDPFWLSRSIAGQTAFRAVIDLPESDPLRERLLVWVYRLAEARINHAAFLRAETERLRREHVVAEPEYVRLTPAALLARALSEPPRREAWLGSFLGACSSVADRVGTLWERRQEVAMRLGLPSPDGIELPNAEVVGAASLFIDRTNDMFFDFAKPSLGSVIGMALGEGAAEGWPRHLLPRTILDWFRDTDLFRSVDLDPDPLPEPYAPASYLLALSRVGAAWSDATAPSDQPFVVAHDPYGLHRRSIGALFGSLPATPAFARRALGIGAPNLDSHKRVLSRALLTAARTAALRVVLRPAALAGKSSLRETFQAEVHRTFRVHVAPSAAGALFRLEVDDAQRFVAMLLSASHAAKLRETHEDDWYRNPRAIEQLRDEARIPPERRASDAALTAGSDAICSALAQALG